jgi:AraC-like DNA-binding protein
MNASAPLIGFEAMRTRRVEEARHLLQTQGAVSFDTVDRGEGFEARANFAPLGDVAICYCEYATAVNLQFSGTTTVRQLVCLTGAGRSAAGDWRSEVSAQNWSAVVPDSVPVDFRFSGDYRQLVVRIDRGRLDRTFSALWGAPHSGSRFTPRSDPRSTQMLALRRAIEFAVAELEIAGRDTSPVALAELQDLIVTCFLHSHHVDLVDQPRDALLPSRPQMLRLEDYLREHWNEPITVERLAAIADVGARSIFRYFKQAHGATPLDYMKTMRLQEARRGLQNPLQDTSVSSEALRCGFNNLGHFAKDYRRKFGERPSETLLKARRG